MMQMIENILLIRTMQ